jgi:5-methyltetrahydrofolate--homocysteine methyltransferase
MSIIDMVSKGDIYEIREAVDQAMSVDEASHVLDDLIEGLHLAGERFKTGDAFVPELMAAAKTFKEGLRILEPALRSKPREYVGKIVIGTVRGDVHDIGKNLVALMLESSGFEVIDLGVDVEPEAFTAAVREHRPQIVGMSALLTTTMLEMERTIKALAAAGLHPGVSILVGGAPVTVRFTQAIGADGYASNAAEAVDIAMMLLGDRN